MSLTAPANDEPAHDTGTAPARDLAALDAWLETLSAEQRVEWALAHGDGNPALSSSFGAQSAVTLHMLSRQRPDIPVILVDTGYLFPDTYRFADALVERLKALQQRYGDRFAPRPGWDDAVLREPVI